MKIMRGPSVLGQLLMQSSFGESLDTSPTQHIGEWRSSQPTSAHDNPAIQKGCLSARPGFHPECLGRNAGILKPRDSGKQPRAALGKGSPADAVCSETLVAFLGAPRIPDGGHMSGALWALCMCGGDAKIP